MPPVRHGLSAELMSRIESYKRRRQELLAHAAHINAQVAHLDKKIAAAELLLEDAPASSITEIEAPALDAPAAKPRMRSAANLTAVEAMREIAVRIGRENPTGFSAQQIMKAFRRDDRIDDRSKDIRDGYLYNVMKRLSTERLITKLGRNRWILREFVADADEIPDGVVVPAKDGFKMVPMTKEDRVRELTKQYLSSRPNKTAHRATIAEYLASNEGPLSHDRTPVKALSVYIARWPEFKTDGAGNYTFVEAEKVNRRDDGPPMKGSDVV